MVDPAQPLRELATRAGSLTFEDDIERDAILFRAEMLIRNLAPSDTHYLETLRQISFYPVYPVDDISLRREQWQRGSAAVASLVLTVADQLSTFPLSPPAQPAVQLVESIFEKFHSVARQIRSRHDNRPTLDVRDEYDVQDLLHALLRLRFDDVRAEEHTPSYAGKASRMDFLLKDQKVVVEVKKTRVGLAAAEIGSQLIEDAARYRVHPDCERLVCLVYDPEGLIGNPRGLEVDLTRSDGAIDVRVLIRP